MTHSEALINGNFDLGDPTGFDVDAWAETVREQSVDLKALQKSITNIEAVGDVHNGLVQALVDGSGRIRDLSIDPEAIEGNDAFEVSSLVMEAVQGAYGALDRILAAKFASETSDVNVDLPGNL
jgi:nucleoid-associated protein EbfC